ncbi:MAG: hypothetical protein EOP88_12290 [Verrucomicrobiaceae bacterium]|nr:MAG: hypothetical protein EOP88_12290 [Verrucomicrobiaceae bacterium]
MAPFRSFPDFGRNQKDDTDSAQQQWWLEVLTYARDINDYVAKGMAQEWKDTGPEPKSPELEHLAEMAIAAVRRANKSGNMEGFRDLWPPAHAPLISLLEVNGQSIPVVCILDDGSVVARIGANHKKGKTVHIHDGKVDLLSDIGFFGRCPNGRYFGIAVEDGISIHDGWRGPRVALCPWPDGTEDIPEGFRVAPWDVAPSPSRIIPFPDGRRVLMVSESGIFVLSEDSARRLVPTEEQLRDQFEWSVREDPGDELRMYISMEHGAVSKDGKMIAVGSQDSCHLVFNECLELVGEIGNLSEYPHYAVFSADGSMIAFNSCHFYNGMTIGVPTALLPGLKTEAYEADRRFVNLNDHARVYAAAVRDDEIIIGDASGYVRAFDLKGNHRWQQFVGSSIGDIDVTMDGKTLVVSTYAGFIVRFRLDAGEQQPHQIGSGGHLDDMRWIFWKNEPTPLRW